MILGATLSAFVRIQTNADDPILDRGDELQKTASAAVRGELGCGEAQVKFVTSRGELAAETDLDPVHVFGKVIRTENLLTLLESRAETNRTGAEGPMAGDRADLAYVCMVALVEAKEPLAVSALEKLLADKDEQISAWAAIALIRLDESDQELRTTIRKIDFPAEALQRVARYAVSPPDWLEKSGDQRP